MVMGDKAIAANVARIRDAVASAAIKAGRQPDDVALMAVTKTRTAEEVRGVVAAGVALLGENRVQEAELKIGQLTDVSAQWHLIGHLQRNKAARALRLFDTIQSVDSVRLVAELDGRAREMGKEVSIYLEVNTGAEETKTGVSWDEFDALAESAVKAPSLRVVGLMTIGPLAGGANVAKAFQSLREGLERYKPFLGPDCMQLSMGMTDDFEVAIAEGSTLVRIGRALFDPR